MTRSFAGTIRRRLLRPGPSLRTDRVAIRSRIRRTRLPSASWWLPVVLLVASSSLPVRADDSLRQQAAKIDHRARNLFAHEQFVQAAHEFEKANGLVPHPATMFNAAVAWQRGGELPRAADDFQSALEMGGLDAGRTFQAKQALRRLRRQLCWVQVDEPLGAVISVEHLKKASVPASVHLRPGRHKMHVRLKSDVEKDLEFDCVAGQTMTLAIAPVRVDDTSRSDDVRREGGSASPAQGNGDKVDWSRDTSSAPSSTNTWAWVSLSFAAAGAVGVAYFGLDTLDQRDRFEASGLTDIEAHDRAVRSRTLANVSLGVSVVAGATAWWLFSLPTGDDVQNSRATVAVNPTGMVATVHF